MARSAEILRVNQPMEYKKRWGVRFLFPNFFYNIGHQEMSKKGTGQDTVGKKSCHVNDINFLSKKFIVEVQTAHHFEAF